MSPSVAARPLFFAARAWPFSRRTFLAPSTSPSDSSSARFTSIIPAAVSSRSCLIFSIVLANVLTSPRSLRSRRPAFHRRHARTLLPLLFPAPRPPQKLRVQRSQGRRPPPRRPPLRPHPSRQYLSRRSPFRQYPWTPAPLLVRPLPRTRPQPRSPPWYPPRVLL